MLKLKLQYSSHLMQRADSLEKTLMLGKIKSGGEGVTEDKMVGWHHQLNGHEFEQTLEDDEGQGSLACYRLEIFSLVTYKNIFTSQQLVSIEIKGSQRVRHN